MRFLHPDGSTVHLSYCSNVHPAETIDGIVEQIHRFSGAVRSELQTDSLGIGLWIPATSAQAFIDNQSSLTQLQQALRDEQVEVVTLNSFPYGGFHDPVVKHKVYKPDWTEQARFDYTLNCARLLAHIMPDDVTEGSISTLPFAWPGADSARLLSEGQAALARLADELTKLQSETGKTIRIAVEPEPGCIVETSLQAVDALRNVAPEWIGVCLDMCHMAVQFENSADSVAALQQANVSIVKSQISSAIRATDVSTSRDRLQAFVEPRFLHQTREQNPDGTVSGVDDLSQALHGDLPGEGEWRVHHHQPIHLTGDDTTQPFITEALRALVGGPSALTHHLDVETYTWSVLPESLRPMDDAGLVKGIAGELVWVRETLLNMGMREGK